MSASRLTPDQWSELQKASEAGVDDETLSSSYGVSREAIRKARSRGKWMTPERVQLEAEKARLEEKYKKLATGALSHKSQETPSALQIVGASLAEMGEKAQVMLSSYTLGKLEETVTKDLLSAPDSWKNYASAQASLWKSLGLDKPESSVSVSVWGGSAGLSHDLRDVDGQTRELTSEERGMLE